MSKSKFYTTKDVLKRVRITRPTLYKWLKEGRIHEVVRDRNNFRLFSEKDIKEILAYKNVRRAPVSNNFHNGQKNKMGVGK